MSTETLTSLGLSAADIKYNLDILAGKTAYPSNGSKIQPHDINQISLEFIEIFASQIQEIEQRNNGKSTAATQELNDHLAAAAGRIYNCLDRKLLSPELKPNVAQNIQVPLIGDAPINPSQLILDHTAKTIKAGLTKLEGHHTVLKIKGDGHCLFRGIATGLLINYESATPSERHKFIQHFENVKIQFPQITEDLDQMIRILSQSRSMLETMKTPKTSDAFVQILRRLACEYNKTNEDLSSIIVAESRTDIHTYLNEMSDMQTAKYGGHPELLALSQVLGTKIRVVDAAVQNRPGIHYTDFEPAKDYLPSYSISLLLRPGHFDYLVT